MVTPNEGEAEVQSLEQSVEQESLITEETPEPEPIDWSARGPELEAQLRKIENDYKSLQGQDRRRTNEDQWRNDIQDQLASFQATLGKALAGMASGDPDTALREISQAQEASAQQRQQSQAVSRYEHLQDQLLNIVHGGADSENLLISQEDSQKLLAMWNTAAAQFNQTGDAGPLYQAQIEAQKMVLAEERRAKDAEIRKEREASRKREKQALERAGVYDHDTGPITGGAREALQGTSAIERGLRENSPLARKMRGEP